MVKDNQSSLFNSFLRDSESFIKGLNRSLLALEQNPRDPNHIDELFRNAHSLKSEADYLNQTEIAAEAHQIESAIQTIRDHSEAPNRSQFDAFFSSVDKVQEMLGQLRQHRMHSKGQKKDQSRETVLEASRNEEPFMPMLSDFEKSLLRESRKREERFFRVYVELSDQAELPYAKAYLIMSNLEQLVQVVHSEPQFGAAAADEDPKRFLQLMFFCTGNLPESELYRAVNIDQIKKISISPLDYKSVLGEQVRKSDSLEFTNELQVHINGGDLDELNGYVDELKIRAHRLKRELSASLGKESEHLSLFTRLVDDLEAFTHRISLVQLDNALQPHYRLVRDLASALDKEVELHLERCNITLDRRAAELISEIIVHLLRNAVSHGIEKPVERAQKGKASMGRITIAAEKEDEQIRITVADDGAGIDEDGLKQQARKAGIEAGSNDELLSYLVYPGLSTLSEADSRAGRGYGLDLVYQKLQEFEGGKLEVASHPGLGTSFIMTLPAGFSILSLLVIRYENKLVAIPAKYVESQIELKSGRFLSGKNGELFWNEFPVFNPEGQLFYTDTYPPQSLGVVISYLKYKVLVLVDEILFQKEVAEESITLYIAGSPHLHKMSLYNTESELYYLSPSIAVTGSL
ncbi:MAG: Hpt domain-containing protein [Spirochaetaceae bacterium]|nr:Hpt domain-containing protein [Spirochaetaceae bacterium]MCF7947107.1 Hpt domain-containing protein [Spirochaetia bacterium]MCF7950108.1 Hpt domain-containing protein [Spirochaetaceae bacterium]